jgi:hypothetical protein
MDTNGHGSGVHSCPMMVQQGFRSAKRFARWFPEAKWPVNQVKAGGMWSGMTRLGGWDRLWNAFPARCMHHRLAHCVASRHKVW